MISTKLRVRFPVSKQGAGTLYIQVIRERKVKVISLPYKLLRSEWDNKNEKVLIPQGCSIERKEYLQNVRVQMIGHIKQIRNIIQVFEEKGNYTLEEIVSQYDCINRNDCILAFTANVINTLEDNGQWVTARHYKSTYNLLLIYLRGNDMRFDEITPHMLRNFECYLRNNGYCNNTISFYFRVLRAVWNRAISEGIIELQASPFRYVYTGIERTKKRAIREEMIWLLKSLKDELKPGLKLARDLFLFSFYTQGMSFVDVAYLTHDNIHGDILTYTRHKTGQEIRVKLLPVAKKIIKRYLLLASHNYLFPILKSPDPSQREYDSALRLQNKRLNKLGEMIGVEKLTTYVARHTWASVAKQKGVPEDVISDCMGHRSLETTRIYIALLDYSRNEQANEIVVTGKKCDMNRFTKGCL